MHGSCGECPEPQLRSWISHEPAGRCDDTLPRRYAPRVDLDASTLVAGFLVSGVGFVLFSYGRKMSRFPHVIMGLVLMVFPYFVPGVLLMFGIAALLCGLLYLATRAGY